MRKFMIRCDVEGVTGIVSYDQAEPGRPEYEFGRSMFMSDLCALVEGLNAGGADEIVIYDEHYCGRNIDLEKLPPNATAICGKPPYRKDWPGGIDESFSGLVLLGFHSKYGTSGGLLPHSYELDIKDIKVNGLSVGEIGVETMIAGDRNVPLIMICGDSAGIAEARALVSGIHCVTVKEALHETGALCYPAPVTRQHIYDTAKAAAGDTARPAPLKMTGGVTMDITFNTGVYLEGLQKYHAEKMIAADMISFTGADVAEVWSEYWDIKLNTQKRI